MACAVWVRVNAPRAVAAIEICSVTGLGKKISTGLSHAAPTLVSPPRAPCLPPGAGPTAALCVQVRVRRCAAESSRGCGGNAPTSALLDCREKRWGGSQAHPAQAYVLPPHTAHGSTANELTTSSSTVCERPALTGCANVTDEGLAAAVASLSNHVHPDLTRPQRPQHEPAKERRPCCHRVYQCQLCPRPRSRLLGLSYTHPHPTHALSAPMSDGSHGSATETRGGRGRAAVAMATVEVIPSQPVTQRPLSPLLHTEPHTEPQPEPTSREPAADASSLRLFVVQ